MRILEENKRLLEESKTLEIKIISLKDVIQQLKDQICNCELSAKASKTKLQKDVVYKERKLIEAQEETALTREQLLLAERMNAKLQEVNSILQKRIRELEGGESSSSSKLTPAQNFNKFQLKAENDSLKMQIEELRKNLAKERKKVLSLRRGMSSETWTVDKANSILGGKGNPDMQKKRSEENLFGEFFKVARS